MKDVKLSVIAQYHTTYLPPRCRKSRSATGIGVWVKIVKVAENEDEFPVSVRVKSHEPAREYRGFEGRLYLKHHMLTKPVLRDELVEPNQLIPHYFVNYNAENVLLDKDVTPSKVSPEKVIFNQNAQTFFEVHKRQYGLTAFPSPWVSYSRNQDECEMQETLDAVFDHAVIFKNELWIMTDYEPIFRIYNFIGSLPVIMEDTMGYSMFEEQAWSTFGYCFRLDEAEIARKFVMDMLRKYRYDQDKIDEHDKSMDEYISKVELLRPEFLSAPFFEERESAFVESEIEAALTEMFNLRQHPELREKCIKKEIPLQLTQAFFQQKPKPDYSSIQEFVQKSILQMLPG